MPRALRWIIALAVAMTLTKLLTDGIMEAAKPQEVRNWEAGKEVWYRPLPVSVAKSVVAQIDRERRSRLLEAREPAGSEWEFAVASFLGSFVDPIALAIVAIFTFVMLRLLPRQRPKNVDGQV